MPTYVSTVPVPEVQPVWWTDGMLSHNRALHSIAR